MPVQPEFSRPLRADRIGVEGRTEHLLASPAEREALARRFGIESVDRLEAEVTLRREAGGRIAARGRLSADVVQACVISLEPVPQRVEEPVDLRFVPAAGAALAEAMGEEEEAPQAPDVVPMDPGGTFDLGEALAQQLALALEPYPRAEGATLPRLDAAGGEPPARPAAGGAGSHPFAALERLRRTGGR